MIRIIETNLNREESILIIYSPSYIYIRIYILLILKIIFYISCGFKIEHACFVNSHMNHPIHKYTYMQPLVSIRSDKLSNLGIYVRFCIGGRAKGCKIR